MCDIGVCCNFFGNPEMAIGSEISLYKPSWWFQNPTHSFLATKICVKMACTTEPQHTLKSRKCGQRTGILLGFDPKVVRTLRSGAPKHALLCEVESTSHYCDRSESSLETLTQSVSQCTKRYERPRHNQGPGSLAKDHSQSKQLGTKGKAHRFRNLMSGGPQSFNRQEKHVSLSSADRIVSGCNNGSTVCSQVARLSKDFKSDSRLKGSHWQQLFGKSQVFGESLRTKWHVRHLPASFEE